MQTLSAIRAHSLGLPGYISVMHTIPVILTIVGLLPDRPHILRLTKC